MTGLVEGVKPHLWFTLYELLRSGAAGRPIRISTTDLSAQMGYSQQSASRHLMLLEQLGLVSRRIGSDGSLISITSDGRKALEEVYYVLKRQIEASAEEALSFEGTVFSGMYQGAYYISQYGYRRQIIERLGFDPYPGTLNLRLREDGLEARRRLESMPGTQIEGFRGVDRAFGGARCYPVLVNDEVEGALIVADRTGYDASVIEVIAPISLRERFGLDDGDSVRLTYLSSVVGDTPR